MADKQKYKHEVWVDGVLEQEWVNTQSAKDYENYNYKNKMFKLITREVDDSVFSGEMQELDAIQRKTYELTELASEFSEDIKKIHAIKDEIEEIKLLVKSHECKIYSHLDEVKFVYKAINTIANFCLKNKQAVQDLSAKLDADDVTNLDDDYETTIMANYQ